jgi:5-phospho-D-xylono-1,4-lactonase
MATVTTVLGPVPPRALGVTDAHSHLFIGPVVGGAPGAPILADVEAVNRELEAFRAMGGGAIIDCQPGFDCGRDGQVLRNLSERTGILVVAATGFHRRLYYPPDTALFKLTAEQAADQFRAEINDGLAETRDIRQHVWPGFIKIAAETTLDDSPLALFEAAAAVCRETGYAIEMHTERGAAVEDFLAFFGGQGVSPRRLVFCHVDKRPDIGLHRELARAGVMLEYDTFYRPKYRPDETVWPLLREMTAAGLAGQAALATDMADPMLWAEIGGGPGLAGIFSLIKPRLEQMGLPEETITGLLGGNIAGRLAVETNQTSEVSEDLRGIQEQA